MDPVLDRRHGGRSTLGDPHAAMGGSPGAPAPLVAWAVEPISSMPRARRGRAARRAFFGTLGVVEAEPLLPLLQPAAMVREHGPARRAGA
ncbi:MAG: hypothetical protein U0168_24025 [Nannocystaceae bacterium]